MLRERLVAVVGPDNAARIEELIKLAGGVALTLFNQGPAAAWKEIVAEAQNLKEQALGLVRDGILDVAKKGIAKFIAGLVVPGGGFVLAAKGIYDTIMTFVEKGKQILAVVTAFLESVQKIASGNIAAAAGAVERTIAKIIPVALAFVAKLLNLDGITDKIQEGLAKIKAPVDKAVNTVLDKVQKVAQPLWDKIKAGIDKVVDKGKAVVSGAVDKVAGWLGLRKSFQVNGEEHNLFLAEKAARPRLMMASTPQAYDQFLKDASAGKLSKFTPEAKKSYQAALAIAQQVDAELALGTPTPSTTSKVARLLDQLAPHTVTISREAQRLTGTGKGVYDLVLASPTAAGYGRSMTLTFSGPAIGKKAGTSPKRSFRKLPDFDPLNQRWYGRTKFYVLGHLLNDNLGGTGQDMRNLTPLFRNVNQDHLHAVEAAAKDRKDEVLAGENYTVVYSVIPTYGRTVNQALINELKQANDPDFAAKKATIEAEAHVPLNLVCRLQTWEPTPDGKSTTLVAAKSVNETVANYILQFAEDYQMKKVERHRPLHLSSADQLQLAGFTADEARLVRKAAAANSYQPFTDENQVVNLMGAGVAFNKIRLKALLDNGRVSLK